MLVQFRDRTSAVIYETRLECVPRVGESIRFPSGRCAVVQHVEYQLDSHDLATQTVAALRVR